MGSVAKGVLERIAVDLVMIQVGRRTRSERDVSVHALPAM